MFSFLQLKDELSDIGRVEKFAQWWLNNTDMIHENVLNYTNQLKRPMPEVCNYTLKEDMHVCRTEICLSCRVMNCARVPL